MSDFIFQLRRGSTAEWAASSRILLRGEPGFDSDLSILKLGDGIRLWADLPPSNPLTDEQLTAFADDPNSGLAASIRVAAVEVIALDGTVVSAAASAVTADIAGRDLVEAGFGDSEEIKAGFRSESGRSTDLVVREDGAVPDSVLTRWSLRLRESFGVAPGKPYATDVAAGGIAGENGRLLLGWDAGGNLVADSVSRLRAALAVPDSPTSADVFDGARLLRDSAGVILTSRADHIAAWGDSLTQGFPRPPFASDLSDSWPGVLDAEWAGTVFNGGVHGQSADEIAIRQGGYQVHLAADVTIPASGGVTVTLEQVIAWRVDRVWSCVGTLAGIPGTLSRAAASATIIFTRTTSGSSTPATAGMPFVSTLGETHAESVQVIFAGRNDITYTSSAGGIVDRVVAATVAMVERPGVRHRRTLVVGTTTASNEYTGGTGHTQVKQINAELAALYPDKWYDLRGYLATQAIYDLGITPTTADLTSMAGDTLPPSIMEDTVHYLPSTAALVATKIKAQLTAKGWII